MSKQAMTLALEALIELVPEDGYKVGDQWLCDTIESCTVDVTEYEKAYAAIAALKEAIKQHDAEPVLYQCTTCGGANYGCTCESMKNCTTPIFASPQPTKGDE